MWAKIITIKRTKDLNYFSLCAFNLFNTRFSQFELNYWNKWTFPRYSNLLRCTCTIQRFKKCVLLNMFVETMIIVFRIFWWKETSKEQCLFEIDIFCKIMNISLLSLLINLLTKSYETILFYCFCALLSLSTAEWLCDFRPNVWSWCCVVRSSSGVFSK